MQSLPNQAGDTTDQVCSYKNVCLPHESRKANVIAARPASWSTAQLEPSPRTSQRLEIFELSWTGYNHTHHWLKAYIWAHLQQQAGLLIPSCGDMIEARIKSQPAIQPVSQHYCPAWLRTCIIVPSASLSLYCNWGSTVQQMLEARLWSYKSIMQYHYSCYTSSSINRLQATFCE